MRPSYQWLLPWVAGLVFCAPGGAHGQVDLVGLVRRVRSGQVEIVSARPGTTPVRTHARFDAGQLAATIECGQGPGGPGQGLAGVDRIAFSCGLDQPDPWVRRKIGMHLGPIRTPLIPMPGQPLSEVLGGAGGAQPLSSSAEKPDRLQALTADLCGTLQPGIHRAALAAGGRGPVLTMEVCPGTATTLKLQARVATRPGSDGQPVSISCSSRASLSRPMMLGLEVRMPGLLAPLDALIRGIKLPLDAVQLELLDSTAGRQQARIGLTVHGWSSPLVWLPPVWLPLGSTPPVSTTPPPPVSTPPPPVSTPPPPVSTPPPPVSTPAVSTPAREPSWSWLGQALRSVAPREVHGALTVRTRDTMLQCGQILVRPVPDSSGAVDVRQATGEFHIGDTSISFRDLSLQLDPSMLAPFQR